MEGEKGLGPVTSAWLRLGVRRRTPVAPVPLSCPLREGRLGLVSTGGARLPDQEPFQTGKRGDATYREIPVDTELARLVWEHPHYDTTLAERDPDTVFPLRLLGRAVRRGAVGSVAPTAISMMGYTPLTRELERESAPAIGELMQGMAVDAVLLCPA